MEYRNKETKLVIEGKEFEIIPFRIETTPKWYIPSLGLVIEMRKRSDENLPPFKRYFWDGASGSIGTDFKEHPLENMIGYAEDLIADLNKDLENFLDDKIRENKPNREKWKEELERLQARQKRAYEGLGELKLLRKQKELKENVRKE